MQNSRNCFFLFAILFTSWLFSQRTQRKKTQHFYSLRYQSDSTKLSESVILYLARSAWNRSLAHGVKQTPPHTYMEGLILQTEMNITHIPWENVLLCSELSPFFYLMMCVYHYSTQQAQRVLQSHHLHHLHSQTWNLSQMSDLSPRLWLWAYGFYLN